MTTTQLLAAGKQTATQKAPLPTIPLDALLENTTGYNEVKFNDGGIVVNFHQADGTRIGVNLGPTAKAATAGLKLDQVGAKLLSIAAMSIVVNTEDKAGNPLVRPRFTFSIPGAGMETTTVKDVKSILGAAKEKLQGVK